MEPADKLWWIATTTFLVVFIVFLILSLNAVNKRRGAKVY